MRERLGLFIFILGLALFSTFAASAVFTAYLDLETAGIVSTGMIWLIILISFGWGTAILIRERSLLGLATLLIGLNVLRAYLGTLGLSPALFDLVTIGFSWATVAVFIWVVLREIHILSRGATLALSATLPGFLVATNTAQVVFITGGVAVFGMAILIAAIWVTTKVAGKLFKPGYSVKVKVLLRRKDSLVKLLGNTNKKIEDLQKELSDLSGKRERSEKDVARERTAREDLGRLIRLAEDRELKIRRIDRDLERLASEYLQKKQ